LPSFTEVLN